MKIDNINKLNAIKGYEQVQKAPEVKKNGICNKDSLELSKDYVAYEKAMKSLKETCDAENMKKVEVLKELVSKGEYKVSSKELAEIIINKVKSNKCE